MVLKKQICVILVVLVICGVVAALATSVSTSAGTNQKATLVFRQTSKSFVLGNGRAKISYKSSKGQQVSVWIVNSKGLGIAFLQMSFVNGNATKTIYWNGRLRPAGSKEFGNYASTGWYRAKISAGGNNVYSAKITLLAGAKQSLSKVLVSPSGFVGDKGISASFCVSRKFDVKITLLSKAKGMKTAYVRWIRDATPKKIVKILVKGISSSGNELGLKAGVLLAPGDYILKISSLRATVSKNVRFFERISPVKEFSVTKNGEEYIVMWSKCVGANSYELALSGVVQGQIAKYSSNIAVFKGKMICSVGAALGTVDEYAVEIFAKGDVLHPKVAIGKFKYSTFGKLETPKGATFLENSAGIYAYCDPVEFADSYEIKVTYNGTEIKTLKVEGSSKALVTQLVRDNGSGEYGFSVKAYSKKNKCFEASEAVEGIKYIFDGHKTPTGLKVTSDASGNYNADWEVVDGVEYYVVSLYIAGVRENVILCGKNKCNLTPFVPEKGSEYEITIYSLGNTEHQESLPSERIKFIA
ncbi:MAG: hypothetical protein WCQ41_07820 [Bacillota bacterium]